MLPLEAPLIAVHVQVDKVWEVTDRNRCGKVHLRDFARGCGHVLLAHAAATDAAAAQAEGVELADLKEVCSLLSLLEQRYKC